MTELEPEGEKKEALKSLVKSLKSATDLKLEYDELISDGVTFQDESVKKFFADD